jgi:enhancing lycopene biosynthesis protein 2
MKKVAVVLSGCGYLDGAEIQEAVLTLLALDRAGAKIICSAPDIPQFHTVDHIAGKSMEADKRNVLIESARIARGDIIPLSKLKIADFDALIFPGGYGVAKNLCTFGIDGPNCRINADAKRLILDTLKAKKPLGVMCIAPALAAKATEGSEFQLILTIGNDAGTAKAIESLGAKHIDCPVDDIVVDTKHKVVSTPAYMLGPSISHIAKGIDKLVDKVLKLI